MFKNRTFEKALDRATSELLLEADLEAMLQTCDEIRQKEVAPKAALGSLRRKLRDENPHVITYALSVLECWMKNCGPPMHLEVANRDFMDFLKDTLKDLPEKPKQKLLELIQTWSYAFKDRHRIITETYSALKSDGYDFPEYVEPDTLFDAEMAPEWKDSNNCYHCRVEFGLITRKHHCRNCGEIFCGDCTKKQCVIPKYGYEREVRVCDACFDELTRKSSGAAPTGGSKQSSSSGSSRNGSTSAETPAALAERQRRERELQLQEEEELQLVMAISQSEYESQVASKTSKPRTSNNTAASTAKTSAPAPSTPAAPGSGTTTGAGDVSSELDRYLDRAYWENRQRQQQVVVAAPSAPSPSDSIAVTLNQAPAPGTPGKTGAAANNTPVVKSEETEQFVRVLQTQISAFLARLKFDQQRGREVTSDAAVQTQFAQLSRAHDVLLGFMREADDRRNYYESLQEKLLQLTDAREALDSLRTEQMERRRRQAEEEERQRRIQMAGKLEFMRQKKNEYLEMQRRQALARLEEQQRDMALRLEQQKAMRLSQNPQMAYYQMMGVPGAAPPGYFPQQGIPGQQGYAPQNVGPAQYGPHGGQQMPGVGGSWNAPPGQMMQQQQGAVPDQTQQQQPQQQQQTQQLPPQQQQWAPNPAANVGAPQQFATGPMQYVPASGMQPQMQGQTALPAQVVPNPGMQQGMMLPPGAAPQQNTQMAPPIYYQQQQPFPTMPMGGSPQVPHLQQQQHAAVVPNQPPPTVAELINFD